MARIERTATARRNDDDHDLQPRCGALTSINAGSALGWFRRTILIRSFRSDEYAVEDLVNILGNLDRNDDAMLSVKAHSSIW